MYSAPEILKGDRCDEKLDLWALGCVLFVLVSGDSPFYGEDCQARILEAGPKLLVSSKTLNLKRSVMDGDGSTSLFFQADAVWGSVRDMLALWFSKSACSGLVVGLQKTSEERVLF